MAAITLVVKDIRPLPGAVVQRFNAGATITPGMLVYIAADGDVEGADANVVGSAQGRGIVVSDDKGSLSFVSGARVDVVLEGPVAGFTSLTKGATVFNSVTIGKMDQTAPTLTGDFSFSVGFAMTDTIIYVQPDTKVPVVNP